MFGKFALFLLFFKCCLSFAEITRLDVQYINETVKTWAQEVSKELSTLTQLARRNKAAESFTNTDVIEEKWDIIVETVANNIREMMAEKIEAVKAIKNHAEALSFHRKPSINMTSSYDFYDTSNLTATEGVEDRSDDLLEAEYFWKCRIPENTPGLCFDNKYQADGTHQSYDDLQQDYDNFNSRTKRAVRWPWCSDILFMGQSDIYYRSMNMKYNPHYDTEVNMNYSIVRVTPNVHGRAEDVINGIRWSEALDLTFKCNKQRDPTLTYQYFGSPNGFLRFYPAMKWSEDRYNGTYDFRLRSWYIEGIASAKDIIILLDRSGSMKGYRRKIANEIVNSILDTLTDNDYVNIYTFTNTTEPLVDCFNDTLVQANEENLRLLRERLHDFKVEFNGDISHGLRKAFPILWKYREARMGAVVCNQAIMLVTEGVDYDYDEVLFKIYNHLPNEKYYRPIRFFTYLLGTEPNDARRMRSIACANMGYFANITVLEEVREKVLKYLEIMSRPINLSPEIEPQPAWTALYVHMSDRRLSNWLWKKNEGLRQREIFIAYEKEQLIKRGAIFSENQTHFVNETEHPYEHYADMPEYKYLTSVSLPVFDKRPNHTELLGVAGVDVPLVYIKQLTEPHRIGVNGYAFIITNNGYVLDHPDHRKEFKNGILKPTFSRVDFTEVEISDETLEPRQFDDAIIELRKNIVLHIKGRRKLAVRTPIDEMRRVMMGSRHYYHTKIGPFSLVIALPDRYGFLVIRHQKTEITAKEILEIVRKLKNNQNWKVHPKWLYTCKTQRAHRSPELELLYFLERTKNKPKNCSLVLVEALLKDIRATDWFDQDDINFKKLRPRLQEGMVMVFLSTHSGLTRWKSFKMQEDELNNFVHECNKGPDEVYYRRSAEINQDNPDLFLYSVPFHTEGYNENTTLITASNVVFHEKDNKRAPAAAVGFQILHKTLNSFLSALKCSSHKSCKLSCTDSTWKCYVLDNDGYIVLANDTSLIGKSIADVDKTLTDYLVKDEIYKEITVFDYQATCFPKYYSKEPFYGPSAEQAKLMAKPGDCKETPMKCKTIEYLKLQLQKTTPTPCDNELKMYNAVWKSFSRLTSTEDTNDCSCPYIVQPIENTNLMLLVLNGKCCWYEDKTVHENEYPREIIYNQTLPCFIATMNNFTKRHYTKCITKNEKELLLNVDNMNCGGEGIIPAE